MKKIIALVLVMICLFTLVGCGTEKSAVEEEKPSIKIKEIVEINEEDITKVGNYYIYCTDSHVDYLSFLNQFDEAKYEIVNISIAQTRVSSCNSDTSYYVTYKEITQ